MSVGKQVVEPGGKAILRLLLGKNYFNDANTDSMSGFDIPGSLDVIRRMQQGQFSPGPNFDELVGQKLLQDRVKGWGGEWNAWMDNGGKGLGHIYDRMQNADYGSNQGLLGSDVGQLGGIIRSIRDNPNAAANRDPSEAIGKFNQSWANDLPGADWLAASRNARGGANPGDLAGRTGVNWTYGQAAWNQNGPQADQFGRRGVEETKALSNQYEGQLNRDIDAETQLSLADNLGEVRNMLGSSGLGESGIGADAMAGTYRRAIEQANRDKQRTMAGFRESNIGREAEATNLSSQIGAQQAESAQSRMGDVIRQAMQGQLAGQEADLGRDYGASMGALQAAEARRGSREGMQGDLMSRLLMDRYGSQANLARAQMDLGSMFNTEAALSSRRGQELAAQQWAGQFGQGLWGQTRGFRDSDLDRAIRSNQQMREIRQNQLDQMLQAGMMPYDLLSKILTGIQSTPVGGQRVSPWAGAGANAAASYLAGVLPSSFGGGKTYAGPQYDPSLQTGD